MSIFQQEEDEDEEVYTVDVSSNEPPMLILATSKGKILAVELDDICSYKKVPITFGLDREGVFEKSKSAVEEWKEIKKHRPFAPLFRLGERPLYQCEFDKYCFEMSQNPGFEFYKDNCQGNIKIWEKMKGEIEKSP